MLPQPTRFERLVGARVRIPYFGTADMCEAITGTDNERREAMIAIRAAALADDRGSAVRLAKPPPTAFERAIGARMRGSLGTQDEVDVADGCASDEAIAAAEERERLRRQAMGTELATSPSPRTSTAEAAAVADAVPHADVVDGLVERDHVARRVRDLVELK